MRRPAKCPQALLLDDPADRSAEASQEPIPGPDGYWAGISYSAGSGISAASQGVPLLCRTAEAASSRRPPARPTELYEPTNVDVAASAR